MVTPKANHVRSGFDWTQHQEGMMRHIHQRLAAEEQRQVNRLLNRVLLFYALLIVAGLGLTAVKMPTSGFTEARAASDISAMSANVAP